MLERILLPLDGSATAEAVLIQVRRLLKRHDSEVILARIVDTEQSSDAATLDKARTEAKVYLAGIGGRLADTGVRVRCALVREGPSADVLLEIAGREGATLIAMSTHGRTGLSRWIFGSVTEKVLRASGVPVLIVRSFQAGAAGRPEPARSEERAFAKVLMPIDGSEASLAIVPCVAEVAKLFGSTVLVAHVGENPSAQPSQSSSDECLRAASERLSAAGVRAVTLTTGGDPASLILDFSRRHAVDLVAMTTHGRSGLSRWVFGSVTEKVLRGVEVPMLVVRST